MSVFLTKGTKEYLTVAVEDLTDTYSSLEGASNVKFDVLDDGEVAKYSNQPATPAGMTIRCLVDTNSGGAWAEGHYRLFPEFTVGAEDVRLGPFDFYVVE